MFTTLKTMVVDRDQADRNRLVALLEKLDMGIAISSSTQEEINPDYFATHRPDLVFWGIESTQDIIPHFVSVDTLERNFDLVYVLPRSLKNDALSELNPNPCLLKPIDMLQLATVLDRSMARFERKFIMQKMDRMLSLMYLNTNVILELPKLRGAEFVRSEELMYCESDNNYTTVHLRGRSPVLVSKPIRWLEEKLPNGLFVRIHKCYLINLCYLREYFKGDGGQVELQDGTVINVARNRKQVLLDSIRAFVR